MGTSGLIEIKRRIRSIESTKKITKAMGLVATSKLRKVKNVLSTNENYNKLIQEIIKEVIISLPEDYESKYINSNDNGYKVYIVITSDIGLCGGFNNNVITYLNETIAKDKKSEIILVGKKGITYLNKYGLNAIEKLIDIPDIPTEEEIKVLFKYIKGMYEEGNVSEVNVIYTVAKSPIKQEPTCIKLLPLKKDSNNESQYIIEPRADVVFENIINMYIKSKLMECLINSKVSEESARRMAMDGATDNAIEMLRVLNKKFNRIRQSIITEEISEIVGGAEAQNSRR